VADLLFFAELFLHLSRDDGLDVVTPAGCLLQVPYELDFLNELVAHFSVLCVKLVKLHEGVVQLLN